tara:strand:+ start:888 stop:1295 length:408 start_codon:yes stop_codon:yes gene_type:complete
MNKADLKKLIKPLVKECINEVLIEEGLLSNVVAEVARGMQTGLVVEQTTQSLKPSTRPSNKETTRKVNEHREKLMKSIGADAYNGVDLFEGTNPLTTHDVSEPKPGQVDLGSPVDPGVDISSLVGGASRMWDAMK